MLCSTLSWDVWIKISARSVVNNSSFLFVSARLFHQNSAFVTEFWLFFFFSKNRFFSQKPQFFLKFMVSFCFSQFLLYFSEFWHIFAPKFCFCRSLDFSEFGLWCKAMSTLWRRALWFDVTASVLGPLMLNFSLFRLHGVTYLNPALRQADDSCVSVMEVFCVSWQPECSALIKDIRNWLTSWSFSGLFFLRKVHLFEKILQDLTHSC